jgi:ribose transport system permease protein
VTQGIKEPGLRAGTPSDGAMEQDQDRANRSLSRWTGESRIRERSPQIGFVVLFAAVFALFSILRPTDFLDSTSLESIFSTAVVAMLLSTGLVFVLIVRDFDLSIANNAALSGSAAIMLMSSAHVSTVVACLAALVIGMLAGAFNGLIVAWFNANALIATLATSSVFAGIQEWMTNSLQVSSGIKRGFLDITSQKWAGLPADVIVILVIAALMVVVLRYTVFGRHAYAAGSNRAASRLAGVRTKMIRFWAFVIMGGFAGLAGVCLTSIGGSTPAVGSTDSYLLPAYAAAFLGAITIGRGRFTIGAAIVGVVFVNMLQTGLIIVGAPQFTTDLLTGLVLVAAVLISRASASDVSL